MFDTHRPSRNFSFSTHTQTAGQLTHVTVFQERSMSVEELGCARDYINQSLELIVKN
jgi:hypothetical protein